MGQWERCKSLQTVKEDSLSSCELESSLDIQNLRVSHLACSKKEQTSNPHFCSQEKRQVLLSPTLGKCYKTVYKDKVGTETRQLRPVQNPSLSWVSCCCRRGGGKRESGQQNFIHLSSWRLLGPWPLTNHVVARLGFKAVLFTTLFWQPHSLIESENWNRSVIHPRQGNILNYA